MHVEALLQEGGLIREELDQLTPRAEKLTREGARLDDADEELRAASRALNEDIQRFNQAAAELERIAQQRQATCPRESADRALVESCNARALQIQAQAKQQEAQRAALQQRQQTLNRSIEQYNAARREWAGHTQEHEARAALNRRDLSAWLERVRRYFEAEAFRAVYAGAGQPVACRRERLEGLAASPSGGSLEHALDCLRALKEGR